jgi:hypothetical protein
MMAFGSFCPTEVYMRRILAAAASALALLVLGSAAQATQVQVDPRQPDPSYGKSESLTVGTPVGGTIGTVPTPIRALTLSCTVAGNVALTLLDGSILVLTGVPVGIYILPLQVTQVNSSGTTATCTYADLG